MPQLYNFLLLINQVCLQIVHYRHGSFGYVICSVVPCLHYYINAHCSELCLGDVDSSLGKTKGLQIRVGSLADETASRLLLTDFFCEGYQWHLSHRDVVVKNQPTKKTCQGSNWSLNVTLRTESKCLLFVCMGHLSTVKLSTFNLLFSKFLYYLWQISMCRAEVPCSLIWNSFWIY